ncbi:MAG: 30S ribosomal protein S17 [Candidatus Micrarchaeota archaeon]
MAEEKIEIKDEKKKPAKKAKPIEAAEKQAGECTDERCPKHGSLRTRGRIFEGKVVSTKAKKTAVVEIQYLRKVQKYERYEKRRSKIHVHIPDCNTVKEGDTIKLMECRKISKTKAFVIID